MFLKSVFFGELHMLYSSQRHPYTAAAEIVETLICTTCISTCYALLCLPRYPIWVACFSHLLHLSKKKNFPVCHLLQKFPWNNCFNFSSPTSPSCHSRQLLPHFPWPKVPDSTNMTWRPQGAWPPCHRTSRGKKNPKILTLVGRGVVLVMAKLCKNYRKKKVVHFWNGCLH